MNKDNVPQVKTVELYAADENDKKSIRECFDQDTAVDLHDAGINTLSTICPPEEYGEDDNCELLQNIMREMYYRIADLEKQVETLQRNYDLNVKDYGNFLDEKSERIAELEAEKTRLQSGIKDFISTVDRLKKEYIPLITALEAERDKYREALEGVQSECLCGPLSKQSVKVVMILTKVQQALNSKEVGGE